MAFSEVVNRFGQPSLQHDNPFQTQRRFAGSMGGEAGEPVYEFPTLEQIRAHRKKQLMELHESYKRLTNPHEYKAGLTQKLWNLKKQMIGAVSTVNGQLGAQCFSFLL